MNKMSEERMNPNFNLESCLRNKVNEAKRYLEDKHKRQKDGACEESSYAESFIYYFQNVETILDLYHHKKERVDELKQELLQEKEKNKELKDVVKLMSIALTPFETIKKIDSERLRELLERR